MTHKIITATQMNHHLSDILNKVYYKHQTFEIKRGKEIIAKIVPITSTGMPINKLNEFFTNLPTLESEDRKAFMQTLEDIRKQTPMEKNKWD